MSELLMTIPVEDIVPNPEQPRVDFDPAEIASLAESIEEHGLIQPIVVEQNNGDYVLIDGERRLRAVKSLGLSLIKAVTRTYDEPPAIKSESKKLKILSLGWGVQSFTLAAMVALGELEPIDYAIHADTTHESQLTYEFAERWTGWLSDHGVKVITVNPKNANPINNGYGWPDMPLYTEQGGQLKRQCTTYWKIIPMRKYMWKNRNKQSIEQWIGISLDEFQRMKMSGVKYITNRWPLIENKMTRNDCINWLNRNELEIPARSACTFCPFHNSAEWHRIKNNDKDWIEAVQFDKAIRKSRPPFDLFVHPSRKPLDEIDFRTAEEKGQLSLWDNECTGICGV